MRHRRLANALLGSACALLVAQAAKAEVDIADAPLFLVPEIAPNILYILDDSGSMNLSFIPEDICTQRTTRRVKSASYNTLYYDPYVTYTPPLDHDGRSLGDAQFTRAKMNGYADGGTTVDLSRNFRPTWSGSGTGCSDSNTYAQSSGEAAYYYIFYEDHWEPKNRPNGCPTTNQRNDDDCYIKVVVSDRSGPGGKDERTNFANWYQYYRTRLMAAKAGSSIAFATLPTTTRVGYGRLNQGSNTVDGVNTTTVQRGVRDFDGTAREDFFDWLFGMGTATYTPLRRALDAAGQYFTREDDRGPYSTTPGTRGGELLSCRANYTILMSDGYWNNAEAATSGARSNNDGRDGPTIDGPGSQSYRYRATSPFSDGYSNTLADVAMYYWKNDLAPNLTNNVPTSPINPAFWQHMVTFGVGLGVPTAVDPDEAFAAITTGASISWPDPVVNDNSISNLPKGRADELLHAAVNSRGGFFNAQNPTDFTERLSGMLDEIVARVEGSSTSAATSSAVLRSNTRLYTAGFRSSDWSGSFTARAVDSQSGTVGGVVWDAEARLRTMSPSSRRILTVNSSTGAAVELNFASLSSEQQEALNYSAKNARDGLGPDRVSWLRGNEGVNSAFRSRVSTSGVRLLGDIVHSNPQFVTNTDYGYSLLPGEGSSYRAFRASIVNRPKVIYVGANDGMLHAFDAESGDEHFAFMPSELLLPEPGKRHAPVSRLTDPDYTHRYFMDGTAGISDAYINGSWRTVLVGTMGAGGKTVFALDVTDPTNPGLLWEFTHADLGYNVGQPSIARMRNGDWAAIFGNGYNGASGEASLFVVRLSDGTLLRQLGTGAAGDNGLATPVVTDWPRADLLASRVYAGDLLGNLWRFDVSDKDPDSWSVEPLFTATDAGGSPQPITAKPTIAVHPQIGNTLVVMFGTGSYFRTDDSGDLQVQSLYGIFDFAAGASGIDRDDLRQQEILQQGTQSYSAPDGGTLTYEVRTVSAYELTSSHKGWYLDLIDRSAEGERVISAPTFPSGSPQQRVRFTTLIPDTSDPCASSRRGFLMDIDIANGGRHPDAVFDLNLDGEFDSGDSYGDDPVSGVGFGTGEQTTTVKDEEDGDEHLYSGDLEETLIGASEGVSGRQSWRQLR